MIDRNSVGRRMFEARRKRGMTQEALGKAILSKGSHCIREKVRDMESGRIKIKDDVLFEICSVLDVSADYLLGLPCPKRDFTDDAIKTLRAAIDTYGPDAQMKMLLEEMSELQKEICKFWRGEDNAMHIAEEVADVEIMLEQVKMIFGIAGEVNAQRDFKVKRLQLRLNSREDNQGKGVSELESESKK